MKIVITGNPEKGLGKALADHFSAKGNEVVFVRSKDYKDIILEKLKDCDLLINNAYIPNKGQILFLNEFSSNVKRIISIGSLASTFPDMRRPAYTSDKRDLQNFCYNRFTNTSDDGTKHLLLSISGDAYKEVTPITSSIEFWLDNPSVMEIKFTVKNPTK